MNNYKPSPENAIILNESLKFVNSVPYKVPLRFIFYRWYQTIPGSKLTYTSYKRLTIRARKNFWNGWKPDTLIDDTRHAIIRGLPEEPKPSKPDYIKNQDYYIEIWFESKGMQHQFFYHTKDYHVTLVPFGGDPSLYYKDQIAKRLENRNKVYNKPIIILYFGDCDNKGHIIPKSALKDIRDWCDIPFKFVQCGLTIEQAKKYNIPNKPDSKILQYQWEALEDFQAKKIILDCLTKYWKKPREDGTIE